MKRLISLMMSIIIFVCVLAIKSNASLITNNTAFSMTEKNYITGEETEITFELNTESLFDSFNSIYNNQCNYITTNSSTVSSPSTGEFVLVSNTRISPYSSIGLFRITQFAGLPIYSYATAFMVSDNIAITSAHCVYDKANSRFYDGGYFYPGRYGTTISSQPFGATYVDAVSVCTDYITNTNSNISSYYDWAIIKLHDNIGNSCGTISFSSLSYDEIRNATDMFTSGYPQISFGSIINYKQYEQALTPSTIMNDYFSATTTFESGQSGSPVFVNNIACGIVSKTGSITRLTPVSCALINQYISEN